MKKLLLGIAVCCGIDGVSGMDVCQLVEDTIKNPTDISRLTCLTEKLIDLEHGFDNAFDAQDIILQHHNAPYTKQVSCMIASILSDWMGGSHCLRTASFYSEGALSGRFGPFVLSEDDSSF